MAEQEMNELNNNPECANEDARQLSSEEMEGAVGGMGHPDSSVKCPFCGKYYVMRTQEGKCPHRTKRGYLL